MTTPPYLLTLPRELREEVYLHHFASCFSNTVVVAPSAYHTARAKASAALLQVSRIFYAKASEALYKSNEFSLIGGYRTGKSVVQSFLREVLPENTKLVTKLSIDWAVDLISHSPQWGEITKLHQERIDRGSGKQLFWLNVNKRFPRLYRLDEGILGSLQYLPRFQSFRRLTIKLPGSGKDNVLLGHGESEWVNVEGRWAQIEKVFGELKNLRYLKFGRTIELEKVEVLAEKCGVWELEVFWTYNEYIFRNAWFRSQVRGRKWEGNGWLLGLPWDVGREPWGAKKTLRVGEDECPR